MKARTALLASLIVAGVAPSTLACAARSGAAAAATGRTEARTGEPAPDGAPAAGPRPAGKTRVWGRITHVVPFCGGAMLPPHELARREAPKPDRRPYAVRTGDANSDTEPVARLVADVGGAFELWLAPGTYCVVSNAKKVTVTEEPGTVPSPHVDPGCMDAYRRRCDDVLVVGEADLHHDIPLRDPCFYGPCYRGPPPP